MKTILWDWNGTLIDDTELTVRVNEQVFERRGYGHVTVEMYRRLFRFPVKEYYTLLGVSDEDFPAVAREWFEGYCRGYRDVPLWPDAAETVHRFHEAGWRQAIVSASNQEELRKQVALYPELDGMFDAVMGLSHHLASSKVQMALDFMRQIGADPGETWFLGDTCHDAEVAAAIGCPCYLVSGGHQCDEVLENAHVPVCASRRQVCDLLLGGEVQ